MKQQQHGGAIFYSYHALDGTLYQQLAHALRPLVREAHLSEWAAHQMQPGVDTVQARQQGWEDATLILLLLSRDYLASDTHYQEMLNALERQQRGEVRVLPILLRPCDRSAPPLATVRCLPNNGQAITSCGNPEQAFLDIVQEIRQLIGLPRVVISDEHGQLARVRDVRLDQLRVHAARVQVPYIERDQQKKLEAAVGPGQAALVVGHSMSGKTRLAAEVMRQKFPEALLLPAESSKMLRELIEGGLNPAGIVVWLDDLERFLGTDGLTVSLLNRLITSRAIVIATIRVEQRETYRPWSELRPLEWDVLQRFSQILLQRRLTDPELGRVQATVHDLGVLTAVNHYGLAEYLGAGPEALDKFEKGEIINPVGHALVQAAIDWRRTGLTHPISEQVLATALAIYLADRPDVLRTRQTIEEGLAWATKKINETVALLGKTFPDSNGPVFEVFDYLVDEHIRLGTPVPDTMWTLVLKQAPPAELIKVGQAAYVAGRPAMATSAWRRAVAEAGPVVAASATYNLGFLLNEQGDLEGAKAAYQQAIASGYVDIVPMARVNLGNILKEQRDLEGAKAAWQQASASKDTVSASLAAYNLGVLLRERGDLEGAKSAYQQAIDSGHVDMAPKAMYNLGVLLEEQGDLEGAKIAYQQVIIGDHADQAPMAAVNLGAILQEQGDLEGAKSAYQRAIDSGHADQAPIAAYNLGVILKALGNLEGAKIAYQRAIDSGWAEIATLAAQALKRLLSNTPPPATS